MNVLMTGGCGFIGSNFVRYFNKKYPQHKVLNVDKLTYAGNLENLKGLERRRCYKFVKADICNAKVMKDIFEKFRPDVVINFAAESHVDRSVVNAAPFLKTNFLGVSVLLNLSLQYKIGKFLQISTDEVYGSILRGRFTEESMINPSSPYAASKAAADALVMSYHKTHQLPVLITRSSNNYGPYQFPEKLIPLTIINALGDKKIPIYGDGMNVRDWLYIDDNCAAIDLVLQHGQIGEIYNIAGESEFANLYVIKRILRYLGKDKSLMTYVEDRPGHDRRYALSINKMKRQLGWYPKTSFEIGVKRTIDWYTKNKKWIRSTQTGEYRHFYKKYYTQLGLKQI